MLNQHSGIYDQDSWVNDLTSVLTEIIQRPL